MHGISEATFYKWRAKYGGMQVSEVKRLKELEDENRRLKKMYAELSLQNELSRKPWQKSGDAHSALRASHVDDQSETD